MRSSIVRAVIIAAIISSPMVANSQNYYVVVGAFAANEKASEFRGFLPDQFLDTSYTISSNDKELQFYVLKTEDEQSAIAKSVQLRKVIEALQGGPSEIQSLRTVRPSLAEAREESILELGEGSASASASAVSRPANAGNVPPKPVGKYFKFHIESPDGRAVDAPLYHVDFQDGRELASYQSNTFVELLRPGQSHKPMAVVCGLFGYKEIYKEIDYTNPARSDDEAYMDEDGAWVIPYKLERVEKGDVSPMHNVSFYKDAAIMRKQSTAELDELVRMMHLNPYYEITIHSHCNGKNKRQILAPGAKGNYFDVQGSVTINGTARDLTTLRAETIRSYLMDHGIDPARIGVFSWGASDMLVKADSDDAALNDRIEIEFTRD